MAVQEAFSNLIGLLHLVYTPTLGVYSIVSLSYRTDCWLATSHTGLIRAPSINKVATKLASIHSRLRAVTIKYPIIVLFRQAFEMNVKVTSNQLEQRNRPVLYSNRHQCKRKFKFTASISFVTIIAMRNFVISRRGERFDNTTPSVNQLINHKKSGAPEEESDQDRSWVFERHEFAQGFRVWNA
jgi:hypothetical protein